MSEHYECAICLEKYTNPKTLPCGHTFCGRPGRCMEGLENDEGILCALCKTQHKVKEADLKTSIVIQDFVEQSRRQHTCEASSNRSAIQMSNNNKTDNEAPSTSKAAASTKSAKPGDMVKFKRGLFYHWGICVGSDEIIHLTGPTPNESRSVSFVLSGSSFPSGTGIVWRSSISEMGNGCEWSVDNYLDGMYKYGQYFTPRPVAEIIKYANDQSGKTLDFNVATDNCETFAIKCRYRVDKAKSYAARGGGIVMCLLM